jgi:PAS domain S-box-containing protein
MTALPRDSERWSVGRGGGLVGSSSLLTRLIALIILASIPMALLAGAVSWLYADSARRVVEAVRDDVTANAVFIIERELTSRLGTLETLAAVLQTGPVGLPEFHDLASRVKERLGGELTLSNGAGQPLLSTRASRGGALPPRDDTSALQPVIDGRKPFVSDVVAPSPGAPPRVLMSVPVFENGNVGRVLSLELSPAVLSGVLGEAGLRPEWIAAVVDRKGNFVARSREGNLLVGRPARPELVRIAVGSANAGTFSNTVLEGIEVENSFRRVPLSGWTVVIAVPVDILHGGYRRVVWAILGSFGLVVVLMCLLAGYTGRKISKPIEALRMAALSIGQSRPFLWQRQRIHEFNVVGNALRQAHDAVQARDAAQTELDRTSALLSTILNTTPELVYAKDREGRLIAANPALEKLIGKDWSSIEGKNEAEWHAVDDEARAIMENDRRVMQSGESMVFEERFTSPQGSRLFLSTKSPLYDERGLLSGIVGVSTDITERQARAEQMEHVMRELSHRSKNLLTVVQAISSQTMRQSGSFEEFSEKFNGRLAALAKLHDSLIRTEWRGASLRDLVETQLKPFAGDRMAVDGTDIMLKHDVAQHIAMALHELATNAVKYGALSNRSGSIGVSWKSSARDGQAVFELQWSESGGPPVAIPTRHGFGTMVVDRSIRQIAGVEARVDFRPAGLVWIVKAPLASIQASPEGDLPPLFVVNSPKA